MILPTSLLSKNNIKVVLIFTLTLFTADVKKLSMKRENFNTDLLLLSRKKLFNMTNTRFNGWGGLYYIVTAQLYVLLVK